jgi:hypothetical protein
MSKQGTTAVDGVPEPRGMAARGRTGVQTKEAASCRVRRGIRNCCRACGDLAGHRERPRRRCPIRSSVRIAMFVVHYFMLDQIKKC